MEAWAIVLIVLTSMIGLILFAWLLAYIVTRSSSGELDPSLPRVKVDWDAYLGKWYEVARITKRFERGCSNVTATYSRDPQHPGAVRVENSCKRSDGSTKLAHGWAMPFADGAARVSFFPGIYGQYVVARLDTVDGTSVVTNSNRDTLWILSRTPTLEPGKISELLTFAKSIGIDTAQVDVTV